MSDKGKLLEEALNWGPGQEGRERPEEFWRIIMDEPKEAKDDTTNEEV